MSAESTNAQDRGCLWVEADGGFVRPLEVVVGASDGTMTEISGSGVKEGMQVVVGEEGQGDTEGQDNDRRRRQDEQSVLAEAAQGQQTASRTDVAFGSRHTWN